MGGKVVASVISIMLVIGIVAGVVVVMQREGRNGNNPNNNAKDEKEKVSGSAKMVDSLCAPATYKEACIRSLGAVCQKESATPKDFVEAGVRLALQEFAKASNLTDTLVSKAKDTKYPKRTQTAIDACKNYFDVAMDRLGEVDGYAQHRNAYENDFLVWYIRLSLSDAITLTGACVDGFSEVDAYELGRLMNDSVNQGRQMTFNILDIVTAFNKALASLDSTQLAEKSASAAASITGAPGRRLLSFPVDGEGYPAWLSAADRELLGSGSAARKNERKMQEQMKKKKNKKKKNKKKKNKKGLTTGMGGGVATTVGGAVPAVGSVPALAPGARPPPDAVVAQDGSGTYKIIMDAVRAHPGKKLEEQGRRWVIYVKAGTYNQEVFIEKHYANILMYGDGPKATVITGNKNFGIQGIKTDATAPFHVEAPGFFAKDMGFQNTAGTEGHQAVALRTKGLFGVFQNCWFDGYQDTLYVQAGSQFFHNCEITGTIDFIFGDGATLIQNTNILVKKGNKTRSSLLVVTAEGGVSPSAPTGIVIQGSRILAAPDLKPVQSEFTSYLGRPWKPYCRTVIMETEIGDFITPEGYEEWEDKASPNHHLTAFYGEYKNFGPGASMGGRAKWPKLKALSKPEAQRFTLGPFLGGGQWVRDTGIPASFNVAS